MVTEGPTQNTTATSTRGFELRDHLRIVRAYWLGAVIIVLLGVMAGGGWTFTQARVFTSTASGIVQAPGGGDSNLSYAADQLSKSQAESYVQFGRSLNVAKTAKQALGVESSATALLGQVSTTLPAGTSVIDVSATADSPEAAAALADAWIAAMADEIQAIQKDASGLSTATTTLVPLATATLPSAPSSPDVRLALALGGLIGVIGAFVYTFLRHSLDRRVRSAEAVEREFGIPVIGTIPLNPLLTEGKQLVVELPNQTDVDRHLNFSTAESMRELRTNLSYVHVDHKPRVIVVSSPQPSDGKSTVAANLAQTLAASGAGRVVIVDCDLRRPRVSKIFSVAGGAGLTDVLSGRAELGEVMQQTEVSENLWVIGSGRTPPNPSELLGSNALKKVLDELRGHAVVIVDAPPVLAVTDAVVLSAQADGMIIVVSAKKTSHDQLGRTLQLIGRGGGRVLGAVLNRVPSKGADARDYGYYGGSYYYYGDGETPAAADGVAHAPSGGAVPVDVASGGPEYVASSPGSLDGVPTRRRVDAVAAAQGATRRGRRAR